MQFWAILWVVMVKTSVDHVYGMERAHLKAAFRRETSQIRGALTPTIMSKDHSEHFTCKRREVARDIHTVNGFVL